MRKQGQTIFKNSFIGEDFLLNSVKAGILYNEFAKDLPIIDFHCHLSPEDIANDRQFNNITELWLQGDHYKWRVMRGFGIDEKYITGKAGDREKFVKWAETVPHTLRNPLFHWTHLELKRYFGINELLNKDNASYIYDQCNEMLQSSEFSVQNLLRRLKVELICTTDDPSDDLKYHHLLHGQGDTVVLPGFRPDKAINFTSSAEFNSWVEALENLSGLRANYYEEFLDILQNRISYFSLSGCRLSDHGLEKIPLSDWTEEEIRKIFLQIRAGLEITQEDKLKFSVSNLHHLCQMYYKEGWVQQFHLGAIRNNRSKYYKAYGADIGCDSIGDFDQASGLAVFLNRLDEDNALGKTILYNLNPSQNEVFATMLANFNDGNTKGKMQYGAAWWFLDNKEGIISHLNTISNFGLLSTFPGMVTDSRSFMSYPRHEYFRRILCDVLGNEMEKGELPDDIELIGKLVQNVCYFNAKEYVLMC
ncbi:MAG: glucuronate isomerase [Cytophagaceae bacterium]